jgi:integrase
VLRIDPGCHYHQGLAIFVPLERLANAPDRVAQVYVVADYLRPAAVDAGVLAKDDPHRFGFHNLRYSLASFLVRTKTDPKTVQTLLRHANVKTTLQLYAHSVSEDRMAAQGLALGAFLQPPASGAVN